MHAAKIPSQDEVLQVFHRAGFTTLTPLQEQLIPALLRGRDVAVHAPAGSGRTVGFVLPLFLGLRGAGPAPHALIIGPALEDVGKVSRAAARFSRAVRDAPAFVPLGEIEDARREQRRLEKGSTIVAGTTERVIDHIRRGSLPFGELSTVVVNAPAGPGLADFVKDIQFIFAKMSDRPQTILFSATPLADDNELYRLLRHPVVVGHADQPSAAAAGVSAPVSPPPPVASRRPAGAPAGAGISSPPPSAGGHVYIPVGPGGASHKAEVLARVIFGMRIPSAVVYHSSRSDGRLIADALRAAGLRAEAQPPAGTRGQLERRGAARAPAARKLDAVLVPVGAGPAAPESTETSPTHVIFYEAGGSRPARGRVRPGVAVVALVEQGQEKEIARLQEAIGVTMSRGQIPSDDEVLTGAIDRILRRVKEEDASELAWLRSRIRRQVPLLQRPLFMAALLKAQLPPLATAGPPRRAAEGHAVETRAPRQAETPRGEQGRREPARGGQTPGPAPGRPEPPRGEPARGRFGRIAGSAPESARQPRPEARAEQRTDGDFAQLFVSIGRNRRVYARDLSALFTEKLALGAGDLGSVRVFDKYSFVDIVHAKAEEAISRLSGTELKGRTITVNFAKKKEEKEGS